MWKHKIYAKIVLRGSRGSRYKGVFRELEIRKPSKVKDSTSVLRKMFFQISSGSFFFSSVRDVNIYASSIAYN